MMKNLPPLLLLISAAASIQISAAEYERCYDAVNGRDLLCPEDQVLSHDWDSTEWSDFSDDEMLEACCRRNCFAEMNSRSLACEARTFLLDGSVLATPHRGTFTRQGSSLQIYFTDAVNNGAVNCVIWDADILSKKAEVRYWEIKPGS